MIRHLAELGALFMCFAVGVGLVAVSGLCLLWIWGRQDALVGVMPEDSWLASKAKRSPSMIQELVEREMLTLGPETRDQHFLVSFSEAFLLDGDPHFTGRAAWPSHPPMAFDWQRDRVD
jgi:hypothetical protein